MPGNTSPITDQSLKKTFFNLPCPSSWISGPSGAVPCRALGPSSKRFAGELTGKIKIAKLNVDENPSAPAKYGVRGIPTMILFKDGKEVDQIVGNHPKENIVALLQKHAKA